MSTPTRAKIKSVLVMNTLMIAAFDERGEQLPNLQKSVYRLWAEEAEREGYDPEGVEMDTPLGRVKIFKNDYGQWGWREV